MSNQKNRPVGILLTLAGLFVYFALPAILSLQPVSHLGGAFYFFGLSWAISVFFLAVFVLLAGSLGSAGRVTALAIGTVFVLLNVALAVSFLTQGAPFNTAFFTHLDFSTLRIAWATDALRLSLVMLYVVLTPFVIAICFQHVFSRRSGRSRRGLVVASFAAILFTSITNYPLQAMVLHHANTRQSSDRMQAELASMRGWQAQAAEVSGAARNIVLIYLEGVEQNYFDEALFPGLMPKLGKLRQDAIWFSDLEQFPGTSWTVGGIVASQCGVPLLSEGHGNRILAAVDNPFRQISCLAELVKNYGYRTAYLGGATLDFAGKGQFLRDNGYDLALGIDELPKASRHKWGMFDSDLYEHAVELFNGMAEADTPFLFTMLTLDTHHPDGTPSPGCPAYGAPQETMLNAVHCADMLAAEFVEHVRRSPVAQDTVIAIVSDHLLINGAPKKNLASKDRRLTFFMIDPGRQPDHIAAPAAHFDIAPTIMEAAGLQGVELPFGHSLLSHNEGRVFERELSDEDFQAFRIEALAAESDLRKGVSYFFEENRLEIGEARYFSRDAINVHYDNPFARPMDFIGLYFQSAADRYPVVLSEPSQVTSIVGKRESGYVLAASNGGSVCFDEANCVSGRFLGIYDAEKKSLLRASAEQNGNLLTLDPESIEQLF